MVMVTKEAGSEINERDANNDKVEPAPGFSNIEYTKWKIRLSSQRVFPWMGLFLWNRSLFVPCIAKVGNDPISKSEYLAKQISAPCIAEVGNDPHSEELEASLEEEDNGEDSIEVVKAVHQEGLRLKPGKKNDIRIDLEEEKQIFPHQTSSRVITKEERRMRASTTVSKYLSSINLQC